MAKKVFIICGCGVATATAAEYRFIRLMQERGIDDLEVVKIRAGDTASNQSVQKADLIIALTPLPVEVQPPVVQGISFLTGIGMDAAAQEAAEILSRE